jgi:hypothetical protein
MIEDDSFALDHAEIHSVELHVGESDVVHPGPREKRARHPTTGECHPSEGGLFHVRAREVASFYQDICESEAVEVGGRERRMDDARILHEHALEVAVREVTLHSDATDLGAGSDVEIWLRGQVGRKAGRSGSIAFETSHSLEDRSSDPATRARMPVPENTAILSVTESAGAHMHGDKLPGRWFLPPEAGLVGRQCADPTKSGADAGPYYERVAF